MQEPVSSVHAISYGDRPPSRSADRMTSSTAQVSVPSAVASTEGGSTSSATVTVSEAEQPLAPVIVTRNTPGRSTVSCSLVPSSSPASSDHATSYGGRPPWIDAVSSTSLTVQVSVPPDEASTVGAAISCSTVTVSEAEHPLAPVAVKV